MKNNTVLKLIVFFSSLIVISSYAEVTYNERDGLILNCNNQHSESCDSYKVPEELKDDVIESDLSVDTFLNKKYVLMTPKNNSSANVCYSLHLITHNIIAVNESSLLGENQSLCLYQKINNQLVSRFKDAAQWNEILYVEQDGTYQPLFKDECIGCGKVERVYYYPQGNKSVIVTDNEAITDRKPIIKNIIEKTHLLNMPLANDKTKMYLIPGDKVKLLKKQDNFYLIEYANSKKGVIQKWLYCSAIDDC